MSSLIELLKSHRSIRRFNEQQIPEEILVQILEVAFCASTANFQQLATIIRVCDRQKREALSRLAGGQKQIIDAAEFLVFCADLYRSQLCCEIQDKAMQSGFVDQLIDATVDVSLVAQNTLSAAESLGLAGVFSGGIRNNIADVSDLLELPQHVYPVFGMALGYAEEDPEVKPRLPLEVVVKKDTYTADNDKQSIHQYDQLMNSYYRSRTDNKKVNVWSQQIAEKHSKESRPFMLKFLNNKGLGLR